MMTVAVSYIINADGVVAENILSVHVRRVHYMCDVVQRLTVYAQ